MSLVTLCFKHHDGDDENEIYSNIEKDKHKAHKFWKPNSIIGPRMHPQTRRQDSFYTCFYGRLIPSNSSPLSMHLPYHKKQEEEKTYYCRNFEAIS